MVISRIMTRNPITVRPEASVTDAQAIMRRERIHRLPVVDKNNELVGIVSEKDLLYASPSPATTLNVYEMSALLSKLKVEKVMTKKVITVQEDVLIEDAARTMVDGNIGGLPVMRGSTLVGIVTESDVFKLFIEIFGIRRKGLRACIRIPEKRGEIAAVTSAIAERGGNIVSMGTFPGDDPTAGICILKVEDITREKLVEALTASIAEIVDIREV
jgi:acetoin utilization protein AcuB